MMKLARWTGFFLLGIAILLTGVWCALAVWFRFPAGEAVRVALSGGAILVAVGATAMLAGAWRWRTVLAHAAMFALVLSWWGTIKPSNDRDWDPDVAQIATGTVTGDTLVMSNVRNFNWRSNTDFDERWETRTFDLRHLTDVDLIMSYWAGEAIAHTIISFGFSDAPRLAFSIETRKERGESFSTIAGFFREFELSFIAADERDVVRVRSNVRGEDVRIFRLRMSPEKARLLLLEYVSEANALAETPRFYNTATANCTTLVIQMIRTFRPGLPRDIRILLSGFLPDYAFEIGAVDTSISMDELRQRARIGDRARKADADPEFSVRIREGLPIPH